MKLLDTWLIGGGGVAMASALLYVGRVLGRLDATIKDLDDRMGRLEDKADGRWPRQRPARA